MAVLRVRPPHLRRARSWMQSSRLRVPMPRLRARRPRSEAPRWKRSGESSRLKPGKTATSPPSLKPPGQAPATRPMLL